MAHRHNPWRQIDSTVVYSDQWMTLRKDKVIKPDGSIGPYVYVVSRPFVLTIGYDGERLILLRQYRYLQDQPVVEFSGGAVEDGEDPLSTAKREFNEETGLTANKWTRLGSIDNPNHADVYLAEELIEATGGKLDDEGIVEVLKLTRDEVGRLVTSERMTDTKTLAALHLLEQHLT